MKVSELIKELQKCDPNHTVAINVQTLGLSLGPSPSVTPDRVIKGFDWNSGSVFLTFGEKNLALLEREEYLNLIKFLQSSGTMSTHEVNKRYLARREEALKQEIVEFIRGSCNGDVPNCEEDVYQVDNFLINAPEGLDKICKKFNIYTEGDDE